MVSDLNIQNTSDSIRIRHVIEQNSFDIGKMLLKTQVDIIVRSQYSY